MEKDNTSTRSDSVTPSNEALLNVLTALCKVRHSFNKAKLSSAEASTITPKLNELTASVEACYIERIREDFPTGEEKQ